MVLASPDDLAIHLELAVVVPLAGPLLASFTSKALPIPERSDPKA
jgi:hypothetical protein